MEWAERIGGMKVDGMAKQLARHCICLGEDAGVLRLKLDPRHAHLLTDERRKTLERAAAQEDAGVRGIVIEMAPIGADAESPVQRDQRLERERQKAAESALLEDPTARQLQEAFGATVRPGSVQPLDGHDSPQAPRGRPGDNR
jgi:DNA polymerase-3 subunit gamma/tau